MLYKAQVALERLTYLFSDVVIATNESYKELAVKRGCCEPNEVFVVRNGPDLKKFKPVSPQLNLKHGKSYLVGYVGTMSTQDGLDILLDVALNIKSRGRKDIHFTCVGGGPELSDLLSIVKQKRLEDTVTFTGRISDRELLEVLSTSDVCVNPDRPCEMNDISTMIKIAEYMALGKPIVQFNLREGRFSAGDASLYAGGASLYNDNYDMVTDFADKVLWLLEHPEERQRMGEFGKRRVEQCLAWNYSVKKLLAAYECAFEKRCV
jgi:glycosyltransferase involved in cell wall biosynthesis